MPWATVPVVGGIGAGKSRIKKANFDEVRAAIMERSDAVGAALVVTEATAGGAGLDDPQARALLTEYRSHIDTLIPYFRNPAADYAVYTKATCLTAALGVGRTNWLADQNPAYMYEAEINELRLVLNKLLWTLIGDSGFTRAYKIGNGQAGGAYSDGQASVGNGVGAVSPAGGAVFDAGMVGGTFESWLDPGVPYGITAFIPATGDIILDVPFGGASGTDDYEITLPGSWADAWATAKANYAAAGWVEFGPEGSWPYWSTLVSPVVAFLETAYVGFVAGSYSPSIQSNLPDGLTIGTAGSTYQKRVCHMRAKDVLFAIPNVTVLEAKLRFWVYAYAGGMPDLNVYQQAEYAGDALTVASTSGRKTLDLAAPAANSTLHLSVKSSVDDPNPDDYAPPDSNGSRLGFVTYLGAGSGLLLKFGFEYVA